MPQLKLGTIGTNNTAMHALSPQEWDFDDVPDEELRTCLIWECARECSEFIVAEEVSELIEISKPCRRDEFGQKFCKNSLQERNKAIRRLQALDFDLKQFLDRISTCHAGYNRFYEVARYSARPWSRPWQAMNSESRSKAVEQYLDLGIFPPLEPASLGELESLWHSNSQEMLRLKRLKPSTTREAEIAAFTDSEIRAIQIPRGIGDPKSTDVIAGFKINFDLFTDAEIVESFRSWLQTTRHCAPPTRRGKKANDDRAALDGIGMMRCLHWHKISSPEFPEKFRKRGSRACYKGRQLALTRFLDVLPFLTPESRPMFWETAASWQGP